MRPLKAPSAITLKKYGLSLDEWMAHFVAQGSVCAACKRYPQSGRLCVDHEHVRGWKKMPAEERKVYVRGLLCWTCNHYYLARGMSPAIAGNVKEYLERYEARRDAALGQCAMSRNATAAN